MRSLGDPGDAAGQAAAGHEAARGTGAAAASIDFEEVARAEQRRVYTFAHYFLGRREEAEDVTQEVLLRLWTHRDQVDAGTVQPWLLKVTRNACFDQLRRRRLPAHQAAGLEDLPHEPASGDLDPQEKAASADLGRRLKRALLELPEPYRSVLILREIQELQYQEISEVLDMPLNTVRVHIHRGRRALRERLREVTGHASHH